MPPLPEDKRQAMAKLNFGTVNKILLEYDRPFLSPDISEVRKKIMSMVKIAYMYMQKQFFKTKCV